MSEMWGVLRTEEKKEEKEKKDREGVNAKK